MSWWQAVAVGSAALLLVLGALFGMPPHPHFWWERIPDFPAALGFAGAWLLALVAKGVAARWLERPEEYYDD